MITDSFVSKRMAESIERYLMDASVDVREAVKFTVIPSETSSIFVKVQYDDRFVGTLLAVSFNAGDTYGYSKPLDPEPAN